MTLVSDVAPPRCRSFARRPASILMRRLLGRAGAKLVGVPVARDARAARLDHGLQLRPARAQRADRRQPDADTVALPHDRRRARVARRRLELGERPARQAAETGAAVERLLLRLIGGCTSSRRWASAARGALRRRGVRSCARPGDQAGGRHESRSAAATRHPRDTSVDHRVRLIPRTSGRATCSGGRATGESGPGQCGARRRRGPARGELVAERARRLDLVRRGRVRRLPRGRSTASTRIAAICSFSREQVGGLPIAMLEAMASGLRAVVARVGEIGRHRARRTDGPCRPGRRRRRPGRPDRRAPTRSGCPSRDGRRGRGGRPRARLGRGRVARVPRASRFRPLVDDGGAEADVARPGICRACAR